MGYTHYWYRQQTIDPEAYQRILADFRKTLPLFKAIDVQLAGPLGKGQPVLTNEDIAFNGSETCGHPKNHNIVIPWPAKQVKNGVAPSSSKAVSGSWFAGVELEQRTCDGDCSYETFSFPRGESTERTIKDEQGFLFNCTKTAFRPYDLAVTTFLVIAKKHLKDTIKVRSDGELPHWLDAMRICQNGLGYGMDFKLDERSD